MRNSEDDRRASCMILIFARGRSVNEPPKYSDGQTALRLFFFFFVDATIFSFSQSDLICRQAMCGKKVTTAPTITPESFHAFCFC